MQTNRPKALILSAHGYRTFSSAQRYRLSRHLRPKHIACLDKMPLDVLARNLGNRPILGLTRRHLAVVDSKVLAALPYLRALAVYSTGLEWIDLDACKAAGVQALGLGGYATTTLAEHALCSLLSLSRRQHLSDQKARGLVPQDVSLRGWEWKGRKLGIVGMGRIGKAVAIRARAFGLHVAYYDPRPAPASFGTRLPLSRLLATSDGVLLSASMQWGQPPLLNAAMLRRMRPQTVLVNIGRAGLVDHAALRRLLISKRLRGYALDDHLPTEWFKGLPHGSLIQTFHTGWYSDEAIARGTQIWTENLCCLAR